MKIFQSNDGHFFYLYDGITLLKKSSSGRRKNMEFVKEIKKCNQI